MSVCEWLPNCSLFQNRMIIETGFGAILKKKYCDCNNTANCARYIIATQIGPDYLDDSLLPTMVDRALEMIARTKEENIETIGDCI